MPPIINTSDSCNTLVDVNEGHDHSKDVFSTRYEPLYVPSCVYRETEICLPTSPSESSSGRQSSHRECLTLPSSGDSLHDLSSIHDHIVTHPVVKSMADDALNGVPKSHLRRSLQSISSSSQSPAVYVHQREVAHVSTKQYEKRGAILASDSATTCHILAIRTSFPSSSVNDDRDEHAISSLTHLDSADNGSCLEKMFAVHALEARREQKRRLCKQRKRSRVHACEQTRYNMDVHIVGGYNDEKGQSRAITNSIFDVLDTVSREYADCLTITIRTCITSELNDVRSYQNSFTTASYDKKLGPNIGPVVRGFSLDVSDGSCHLLGKVSEDLRGPDEILRRVRLWSSSENSQELMVVHSTKEEGIHIPQFDFSTFAELDAFLMLDDDIILQYASTSPECEDSDYCDLIRKTCRYLRDEKPHSVPRHWTYVGTQQGWALIE